MIRREPPRRCEGRATVDKTRLILLQALASMAWADDYLDDKQRAILAELFIEDQLDPQLAKEWLEGPVAFPDTTQLAGVLPDSSDRLDLVTQMLHMALTDRWLHPGEIALMRQLGKAFGMDKSLLAELDDYCG